MNLLVKTFLFEQDALPFITTSIDETINDWVKENKCTIIEIKAIHIPKPESILFVILYLTDDQNIDLFNDFSNDSVIDLTDFDPNPPIDHP